jgi:hypothetical protein
MLRRIARWYGISTGDLVTYAGSLVVVAAALATWLVMDEGALLRALLAFVAVLALAAAPTLWRLSENARPRLVAYAAVLCLALGLALTAVWADAASGFGFGVAAGLAATLVIKRKTLRATLNLRRAGL